MHNAVAYDSEVDHTLPRKAAMLNDVFDFGKFFRDTARSKASTTWADAGAGYDFEASSLSSASTVSERKVFHRPTMSYHLRGGDHGIQDRTAVPKSA